MMGPQLLHYRAWQGELAAPGWAPWPIARVALSMMFRRKLFWVLYGFALLTFLLFFFGQYLFAWAEAQAGEQSISIMGVRRSPQDFLVLLRDILRLNGKPETYRNFFWWQGYMVMIVLALAGSLMIGNDFQFGSLPFYLSKPLSPWHYVIGKCLAVAVFINLMTTLPALVLYFQYRTLYSWGSLGDEASLFFGIVGYGLVLTIVLSVMLVATASWVRKTVPLIMVWTTLFFFMRQLGNSLVEGLGYDVRWRLIDLWNDTYLIGNWMLGSTIPTPQPQPYEAAIVLGAVSLICLSYLNLRIRAVEIVR